MPTPLNKTMRADFVNAVLREINVKFDDDAYRKIITDEAVKMLPAAVRAIWNDPETKEFVRLIQVGFDAHRNADRKALGLPDSLSRNRYAPNAFVPCGASYKPSEKTKAVVQRLLADTDEREIAAEQLRQRMTAMVDTCKTREALEALFPKLTHYMPVPAVKLPSAGVPAVMVSDFMKDLKKLGVSAKKEGAVTA